MITNVSDSSNGNNDGMQLIINSFVHLSSVHRDFLLSLQFTYSLFSSDFSSLTVKDLKFNKMLTFPSRISTMLLIAGLLCIALLFYSDDVGGYVIPTELIDCSPFPNIDSGTCTARGCIWDENYDKVRFCSIADYYCRTLSF